MKWFDLLSKLPTTNARIAISLSLTVLVVLTLLVIGLVLNHPVNEPVMYAVLSYLSVSQGLDVGQFVMKRKTENPPPTKEDA